MISQFEPRGSEASQIFTPPSTTPMRTPNHADARQIIAPQTTEAEWLIQEVQKKVVIGNYLEITHAGTELDHRSDGIFKMTEILRFWADYGSVLVEKEKENGFVER